MEKWKEIGLIPTGQYETKVIFGEENGLKIELFNEKHRVFLEFGYIYSFRVLEEVIVQSGIYDDEVIKKFKENNFSSVIYKVEQGIYREQVNKISLGFIDMVEHEHYVIITQNYNIDIIAKNKVDIKIQ